MSTDTISTSFEELVNQRRSKLKKIRETNVNPFPTKWDVTHSSSSILEENKELPEEGMASSDVSIAGRLMTRRLMGKASFSHIQDLGGKIQIYLKKDELGEDSFKSYKDNVDLGDIIGVTGTPFRTRTGEITVRAKSWKLLSKALRPPPEKFHGMTDVEIRYRRREVDLFSNESSRQRFFQRQLIVSTMRRVLENKNFIEVETPMMQAVPGGAAAKPFMTHHEALDMDLYMRIAPELYLKRLLVGGLERVYEIGRAFRNEGIDTRHNPEFTILEAYQAYTNYEGMMDLVEEIIQTAAKELRKRKQGEKASLDFEYRGISFSMANPFARLSLVDLFPKYVNMDYKKICHENSWRQSAKKLNLRVDDSTPDHKCFEAILDEKILPHLPSMAFVFGYPAVFSPLAKANAENPDIAERFELFIAGEEVANAYSEQNDPDVQRKHFLEQARKNKEGDEEAMPSDEEFLIALEHGMPPAGGLGIGVDRLTMLLTGTESIREVILFPLLRPEKG